MAKPGMSALRDACKPTIATPTPTPQTTVQQVPVAKKKSGMACGQ